METPTKQEVLEMMIMDCQWAIDYHSNKLQEAKNQMEVLTDKKNEDESDV